MLIRHSQIDQSLMRVPGVGSCSHRDRSGLLRGSCCTTSLLGKKRRSGWSLAPGLGLWWRRRGCCGNWESHLEPWNIKGNKWKRNGRGYYRHYFKLCIQEAFISISPAVPLYPSTVSLYCLLATIKAEYWAKTRSPPSRRSTRRFILVIAVKLWRFSRPGKKNHKLSKDMFDQLQRNKLDPIQKLIYLNLL